MIVVKMAGMEWNGFSEEDIKRIQSSDNTVNVTVPNNANEEKPSKPIIRKGILKKTKYVSENQPIQDPLTPKQRLSKPKVEFATEASSDDTENKIEKISMNDNTNLPDSDNGIERTIIPKNSKHVTIHEEKNTVRQDISILEQFEQRQKQMEQENARRKLLLTKALADRKKKTQAEAQKLLKIQKELSHLDSLLSVDVSILRNQIEIASMDFTEAQKRYQKAEKEFVDAKLELFQKMQHKEKLTEHLCTIIEQNEARKAHKLVELMQQLEMDSITETNTNGIGNILPQLCALNNIDYTLCTTIKPPTTVDNNEDVLENTQDAVEREKDIENANSNPTSNEISNGTKLNTSETNIEKLKPEISEKGDINCNEIAD